MGNGWLSRLRGVRLRANRLPVERLAALAAFTATFTVSVLVLGSSVLSCRRAQCVVWVVGPRLNHTLVVHLGGPHACSAHG